MKLSILLRFFVADTTGFQIQIKQLYPRAMLFKTRLGTINPGLSFNLTFYFSNVYIYYCPKRSRIKPLRTKKITIKDNNQRKSLKNLVGCHQLKFVHFSLFFPELSQAVLWREVLNNANGPLERQSRELQSKLMVKMNSLL